MDQPPHQPAINTEGVLGWAMALIATLSALFVRGRFRIKSMQAKVDAEAKPKLESEFIRESREITAEWKEEVTALRAQVDKVRSDYEVRLSAWMERALNAEKQIPRMEAEILMLKARVAELERQILEGKGHHAGQ